MPSNDVPALLRSWQSLRNNMMEFQPIAIRREWQSIHYDLSVVSGADSRARRCSRTNLLMGRLRYGFEITPFIPLRRRDRTI